MAVVITEYHRWRRPGFLHTGLFPGLCLGFVTKSWARGSFAEATKRQVLRDLARTQPRGVDGRFAGRR